MSIGSVKLTGHTACGGIFNFCKYWPDDGLFRPKLAASD